jgi:hypothetical protein
MKRVNWDAGHKTNAKFACEYWGYWYFNFVTDIKKAFPLANLGCLRFEGSRQKLLPLTDKFCQFSLKKAHFINTSEYI